MVGELKRVAKCGKRMKDGNRSVLCELKMAEKHTAGEKEQRQEEQAQLNEEEEKEEEEK